MMTWPCKHREQSLSDQFSLDMDQVQNVRLISNWGQSDIICNHVRIRTPAIDLVILEHSWLSHDDVIKWITCPRNSPFVQGIHRSPVNSPHKGQWRGALMFSLMSAWLNGWVNNCEAGDLRCHHAHYDVSVMYNQSAAVYSSSTYYLHPKFNTRQLFIAICLKIVLNISNLAYVFYQYVR